MTHRPFTLQRIYGVIRRRLLPGQAINSLRGVYSNFSEAMGAAPRGKPRGYNHAESSDWYKEKLNSVTLEDYPALFWLRDAFEAGGRSVFEVGGHVGVAYYGYASVLRYPPGLMWTILDVPSVVSAGEMLARERGSSDIRFVSNLERSYGADVVLACGSLQYVDKPSLAEMIAGFSVRPTHVIVNSMPVYDGAGFVTVQNIGTAYCAYRIFNRAEFVGSMEAAGYRLIHAWSKPRSVFIPGHPEKSFDTYSGFCFVS